MRDRHFIWLTVLSFALTLSGTGARTIDGTEPGIPEEIKDPPAVPTEFAFTFSMPYGLGDEFPREPEEFDRLGVLGFVAAVAHRNFAWHHLPIPDMSPPGPTFEAAWRAQGGEIMAYLEQGKRLALHCAGGLGRSGTIAAKPYSAAWRLGGYPLKIDAKGIASHDAERISR